MIASFMDVLKSNMRSGWKGNMIFLSLFLFIGSAVNPHLGDLISTIRRNSLSEADVYWDQYTVSLVENRLFSEKTEKLGGLHNIKTLEINFVEGLFTEAEFCHQIGLEFSNEVMPAESEWFLNKAQSLGFVDITTYFANARNYAREWNNNLHYNDHLSDILENRWREALTNAIRVARDSNDIYKALLALTCIYSPARNTQYRDSLAPRYIESLEKFVCTYPDNPFIEKGYEMLVWWLYAIKRFKRLGEVCETFLTQYTNSQISAYIKFHHGNAYYYTGAFEEAKKVYSSIEKDSLPDFVYSGWHKPYIIKDLERKLAELEDNE